MSALPVSSSSLPADPKVSILFITFNHAAIACYLRAEWFSMARLGATAKGREHAGCTARKPM